MVKKITEKFLKLAIFSVVVGVLVGVLELVLGHRFILDPLLYEDLGFVYETYFGPTYYGFTKTIIVSIVTFFIYLIGFKKKMNTILKTAIIGVVGTIILGIYYYFTFPSVASESSVLIGAVHFSFIFVIVYITDKLTRFSGR